MNYASSKKLEFTSMEVGVSGERLNALQGEGFDPTVETPITDEVIKHAKRLQFVLKYSSSPLAFLVVLIIFALMVLALFFPSVNLNLAGGTLTFFHLLIAFPFLLFEVVKMSWFRYLKINAVSRLAYNGYQYKGSWYVVSFITGHVYSLNFLINKDNCC